MERGGKRNKASELCARHSTNITLFSAHDNPSKRLILDPF